VSVYGHASTRFYMEQAYVAEREYRAAFRMRDHTAVSVAESEIDKRLHDALRATKQANAVRRIYDDPEGV
jgi:hypothetical protein